MLEIRVNKVDGDYFYTRINADLEEVARYYFPNREIESIDILDGGVMENEFFKKTPERILRADPEIAEAFELYNNIRMSYKVEYKKPLPDGTTEVISSCGLCRL